MKQIVKGKGMKAIATIFWSCLILAMLGLQAAAQEAPKIPVQSNTVYVAAQGEFEAEPDTAVVEFSIDARGETPEAAYEKGSKGAQQVREMLRSAGIDPKQAEIGFFALGPVYEHREGRSRLVGYQANAQVSVKISDFQKVGPLVEQFSQMEVTARQSVRYVLEKMEDAKQKAIADAFRRARARAEVVAQAGGRKLGNLSFAAVDVQEPGPIMAMRSMEMTAMRGAAPPPTEGFTPNKVTVTAEVKALFELDLP